GLQSASGIREGWDEGYDFRKHDQKSEHDDFHQYEWEDAGKNLLKPDRHRRRAAYDEYVETDGWRDQRDLCHLDHDNAKPDRVIADRHHDREHHGQGHHDDCNGLDQHTEHQKEKNKAHQISKWRQLQSNHEIGNGADKARVGEKAREEHPANDDQENGRTRQHGIQESFLEHLALGTTLQEHD